MDTISLIISLSGVILSFLTIIILNRKKVQFGLSLLIGSGVLALFSLIFTDVISIAQAVAKAVIYSFETQQFQFQTIELAVLMTLIYVLASLMQETGAIGKLIKSLQSFFSKGGTLGLIPAIYGLMPVPGGALFSAPIVDEEGNKFNVSKSEKNFFNVWFRHIWFPVYPISYSIIVMADLARIDIYSLIAMNMFAFFLMILIGFLLLHMILKNKEMNKTSFSKNIKRDYHGFLYLLPPIVPVFFSVLTIVGIPQNISFIIGLVFAMILLFYLSDISMKKYFSIMKNSLTIKFALVIFGIMIFREIFDVSGANTSIFFLFNQLPVPPLFIIIIVPFILGILTGYILSGVTLSFILIQPLFALTQLSVLGLTSIFFLSTFIGYLISPLHLCNVLSSEYLQTDTTRMYKIFIPAALLLLISHIVFVYFFA
jgi:integral membrane protein (TIGR00529 family)